MAPGSRSARHAVHVVHSRGGTTQSDPVSRWSKLGKRGNFEAVGQDEHPARGGALTARNRTRQGASGRKLLKGVAALLGSCSRSPECATHSHRSVARYQLSCRLFHSVLRAAGPIGLLAAPAFAQQGQAASNITADGLALRGHDPVACVTEAQAVLGRAEIAATHAGATYRFVTAAHRDLFVANPERHLPQ